MAQISTNEYNSIRKQILSKANRRADEETLNHPLNHPQSTKMSGGVKRKRKQTEKDKEDERLAMKIEKLDEEMDSDNMDSDNEDMVGGKKAMSLGEELGKKVGHMQDVKKMVGAGFFDDFKKGFIKGVKMIGTPVKKIAKAVGKSIPEAKIAGDVLEAIGLGKGKKAKKAKAKAEVKAKAKPMKSTDKRKVRGAMISKLMKSKGMTLGEASKHIKENNLI